MKILIGITILVVEDERDLRDVIMECLEFRGATVVGVENGLLAFELLKKSYFDVVLSDVRMPGGDGIELIKNINQSLSPKPKVFLYTGYADITEQEAKLLGAIRIFPKPFDMKEMAIIIRQSL